MHGAWGTVINITAVLPALVGHTVSGEYRH